MAQSISKTVAILIILLLASSFVLGNIFAGYKAEKIASNYKENAEARINELENEHRGIVSQQEFDFINLALEQGVPLDQIKPLVEKNGIYLLQIDAAAEDALDDVDWGYLMWINALRKPEKRIFHVHSSIY